MSYGNTINIERMSAPSEIMKQAAFNRGYEDAKDGHFMPFKVNQALRVEYKVGFDTRKRALESVDISDLEKVLGWKS